MPEPDAYKRALGTRVRALREAKGWARRELAEQTGLSLRFLAQVEAGQANPSLGSLRDLARGLGVQTAALVDETDADPVLDEARALLARLPQAERARARDELLARLEGQTSRPIALLGLRGAGKSTVGAALASALGRPFVEVDDHVATRAGMPLADLFELHGEERYRELERETLEALVTGEAGAAVLATGGGVVTHPESWELLRARALSVWLRAPPQAHWDRVVAQGDDRPMAGRARARAELEALYARRAPLYAAADWVIDTEGVGPDALVAQLVARLEGAGGEDRSVP